MEHVPAGGFSLFQIGGFSAQRPGSERRDHDPAAAVVHGAPARSTARCRASTSSRRRRRRQYGPGNYMPDVELVYWSMRVMAYSGVLMFLVAAVGAWLYRRANARDDALVPADGDRRDRLPVHRGDRRLGPHRDGPPAVDRAGPAQDRRTPTRPASAAPRSRRASPSSSSLYVVLGVVDFVLMRRYARLDPPELREGTAAASPALGYCMSLEIFWFCLIAVLWGGYFVLEGFDFGVGMLLPFLPRDERERSTMFETIGPVWDGNEVWLVVAGGATFAAFPAWYATMFSGFYLALLLVLVFLIVRAVSFEWRERSEDPRWRDDVALGQHGGRASARRSYGASRSPTCSTACRSTPTATSRGNVLDLFSAYTVLAGLAVVALFALHGATFLTLRTTGDLCERAAAVARRLCIPVAIARRRRPRLDGRRRASTATTRTSSRRCCRPRSAVAALVLAVILVMRAAQRLGVRRDRGRDRALGGDDLHQRSIRACSSRTRRSPTASPSPGRRPALRARGDHGRRRDLRAGRAALPGLDLPRLPRAPRRRADGGRAGRAAGAQAGRLADGLRAVRALDPRLVRRTRSVRPLLIVDVALGVATTALRAVQATLLAQIVAGAFAGAPAGELRRDAGRAGAGLRGPRRAGLGDGGRGPARGGERPLRAAPGARRAPPGDAADRGRRDAVRRDRRGRRAGRRGARGVLRPLPAAGRARRRSSRSPSWPGWPPSTSSRRCVMAVTLPLVPVFMWLIGRATEQRTPRALARPARAVDGLPRRRARPADAARRSIAAARRRPASPRSASATAARRWGRCASPSSRAPCSSWPPRSASRSSR